MNTCSICNVSLRNGVKTVILQTVGAKTVNDASLSRGQEINVCVASGTIVHEQCRRNFTNKKDIERVKRKRETECTSAESPIKRRSQCLAFHFASDFFFCGLEVSDRSVQEKAAYPVRTYDFQETMYKICEERKDRWATAVLGRIAAAGGDLHAADAVYHQVCSVNFRTGKPPPARFDVNHIKSETKFGRPKDLETESAFISIVNNFINEDEKQKTIIDLCNDMGELCETPYSTVYMKNRLQESLGDRVTISEVQGKANVVTFNETAASILQAYHENSKTMCDIEGEKDRLIRTAVALLKSEIIDKHKSFSKEFYPDPNDLKSVDVMLDFLPDSLRLLLDELLVAKSKGLKMATIGQCLVQGARPRALMAPLQFGLAAQLHHHFGSKFLINTLHAHGLCSSYTEVLDFETCAAVQTPTTADIDTDSVSPVAVVLGDGHFRQYVCDNADRNPWTIDGKTSLHAMGMIEAITPSIRAKALIRRDASKEIKSAIEVLHYDIPCRNKTILYQKLSPINVENTPNKIDLLWKIARSLKSDTPGWSGVMQAVSNGNHAGSATVKFLPMINMQPTNMTCIYSTICFISRECERHNCTPVITFDQPLWLKARTIVGNEPDGSKLKRVIVDLGGFHTMMSYLGCIGHFMTNTGLREVLEMIYGENAVTHVLNGKSYARASRGHILVESMLTRLLIRETYATPPSIDDDVLNSDLRMALELFDGMMDKRIAPGEILENPVMCEISQGIDKIKSELAGFATPELWLQYMTMVDLLRDFIRSQRTGSWSLHKYCLREMLPYFAAAGHNHYAKSVQIHLQDMKELETTNPQMYEMFSAGLFVIRRSDRYWAGLSKDLVIEQTLMRTMKVTGGLVHGRGVISEQQRNKWLLSLPVCATVNESMQELSKCNFSTSQQHKEFASARVKRDNKDAMNIFNFLCENNPFERTNDLRSITSGITADDTVNVHKAKQVGEKIFGKMYGKNVFEFSFSRKDTVVQLGQDKQVRIDGDKVNIDPQLLFQRLLAVGNAHTDEHDIDHLLQYELSSRPTALFDDCGMMREATKSQLTDAIGQICPRFEQADTEPTFTVFDGGSLIHRIQWKKETSFDTICKWYVELVKQSAGPVVVFDGYGNGPSTKDCTHQRRTRGIVGSKISGFSGNKLLTTTKERFLSNNTNKNNFITLLKQHLEIEGVRTAQASGDADCLISQTGVDFSTLGPTFVIGEDTDLLVILCHRANRLLTPVGRLFLRTAKRNAKHKLWDIGHLCQTLGRITSSTLPFIHAVAGCDTTSRLFGIGKGMPLKKMDSPIFREQASIYCAKTCPSQSEIVQAGEKAMVCLYGGRWDENLNTLRLRKFKEKVVTGTSAVEVKALPPTSDSAKYHSLRVFLQVRCWMGDKSGLNPTDWGWELRGETLLPRQMDASFAPQHLLRVIRCTCKGECDTKKCSCRRYGLECTNVCANCHGETCLNATSHVLDEDELEEAVWMDI